MCEVKYLWFVWFQGVSDDLERDDSSTRGSTCVSTRVSLRLLVRFFARLMRG